MRAIVRTILRGFGIQDVFNSADAVAAFDSLRSAPVDLLIADFAMGPVNRCDLTRLKRTASDSPNPFIPVIMLTAYTERSKVEAASDAGVTEFCAKPITAADLYRKISVAVNTPRPFVRTRMYFGPDRRRRPGAQLQGPERRAE